MPGHEDGRKDREQMVLQKGDSMGEKMGSEGNRTGPRETKEWLVLRASTTRTLIYRRDLYWGSDALLCKPTSLSRRANGTL